MARRIGASFAHVRCDRLPRQLPFGKFDLVCCRTGAATTLEKLVYPVQLESNAQHELLETSQWVVFRGDIKESISRLIRELERMQSPEAHRRAWDDRRSPFPGLHPFDIDDAGVFFGRDDLTAQLVAIVDPIAALDHASLVTVIGASGSGKSSLVRAGLVPELQNPTQPRTRWLCVPPAVPGLDCRRELGRSLRSAGLDASAMRTFLAGGSLREAVSALVAGRDDVDRVLVVLDQAEELVTHANRVQILSEFVEAASFGDEADERSRCRVVMTVREGYVARLFAGLDLDSRHRSVLITPMPPTSVAKAIEGPARRADLDLEDGLVQEILHDVGDDDALPLLALALQRTYLSATADGTRKLRIDRYRAIGGVAKAVSGLAADAASSIGPDGEPRLVDLLVQMAAVDEDGHWTRRTVKRSSLSSDQWNIVEALVLEPFRLVVVGGDDDNPTVAVSHSAVFDSWLPLAKALEPMADDLKFFRRLERDASTWEDDGRPRDQLPRGKRFQQIEHIRRRRSDLQLSSTTAEYLGQARRMARRERLRIGSVVGIIVGLGVVAAALGVGQLQAKARASTAERVAEGRRGIARALNEPRFDSAMNIALRALEQDPSRDGLEAILGIVLREPAFRGYPLKVTPYGGRAVAWSIDNELLVGDTQGNVRAVAPDGSVSDTFSAGDVVRAVAPGPDGDWVAIGDRAGRVRIRFPSESRTLELHRSEGAPAHSEVVEDLIAAGPQRVVSVGHDGDVVLWDVAGGDPEWVATVSDEHDSVWSLASLPELNAVVVGTRLGEVATVSLNDGALQTIARLPTAVQTIAAFGGEVLAGDGDGAVWLLDLDPDTPVSAEEDIVFQGQQPVRAIAPVDSERALTGWDDGVVRLINRRGWLLDEFGAHDEPVRDIDYAPDSESFAVTGDDGLVSLWKLSGTSPLIRPLTLDGDLVGAMDASGRLFVAGTTRRLSELQPDGTFVDRSGDFGELVQRLDVNDDGTTAALGFADHAIAIDIAKGHILDDVTPGGEQVRVAMNDNLFIVAGEELVIVNVDTGAEQRLEIPADVAVNSLTVDPGTDTIVVGGKMGDPGGVLLFWRHGASTPVRRNIDRAQVDVLALDIDDDGRWLAVGRNDGRVELWNLDEMELTDIAFTRHVRQITDVAFAPDSATVVSLDTDGIVWLWSAEVGTSYAQPIRSGLGYGRRVLVDSEGTEVIVVGRGGVRSLATDTGTIQETGCTLAAIDPCAATTGNLRTVLRED